MEAAPPEARSLPPGSSPPRPDHRLGVELVLVALLSLAVLLPGLSTYTLIDPWETHYGEVARRMLQDDDFVHTTWQNEGFRSKPILTFWLMAGSMKALGVADHGGYSGEMVASSTTMLAIRLPFVLFGALGLCLAWWMLARMTTRRIAWLAWLVIATAPIYCLIARQGITDMPLAACVIGAIAMFAVANEAGDTPLDPLWRFQLGRRRTLSIDHRHVFLLIVGGFLLWQAVYYVLYFTAHPRLAGIRLGGLHPGLVISVPIVAGMVLLGALEVLHRRTTTYRQIYMYWFWTFVAISVLAKGPPGLAIVGLTCAFYVVLLGKWRELARDRYELLRGLVLLALIAVPWHVAMYFADGRSFVREYIGQHWLARAASGEASDPGAKGTFDHYAAQVGYGMFIWAALIPAAIAGLATRLRTDTPDGRARLVVVIWSIAATAFLSIVAAKYHHYVLPLIPALAIGVAFWLDDVFAGRARHVGVVALLGAGIVLVIANDMMSEQKDWIEMFVFRYDRPWPGAAPWNVDVSDGFLGLGVAAALALVVMALPRLARVGAALLCAVGLAGALWAMYAYMPVAARHWGMRDAIREYYEEREIFGARLVYFGARQAAADWATDDGNVRETWTIRTFVPEATQEGQPVTVRVTIKSVDDRAVEQDVRLNGTISEVDPEGARVVVTLPPAERQKLAGIVKAGRAAGAKTSARRPIREVDADRLIAWQLYWRGENFWSGDEIWGPLPENQTAFKDTDNVKFLKYLNDRELAPEGRRYWIVTEAGRIGSLKTILPTPRAKETFRVENTTSNKFTLASFVL